MLFEIVFDEVNLRQVAEHLDDAGLLMLIWFG